jgi:hypothetical protein
VAGYELQEGGEPLPRIYQMGSATDFAPMVHDYGFGVAGVAQYALYLLNRLYEDIGRNRDELDRAADFPVLARCLGNHVHGKRLKLLHRAVVFTRPAQMRSATVSTEGEPMADYDVDMSTRVLYQVTLASGRIVTRPEDFDFGAPENETGYFPPDFC